MVRRSFAALLVLGLLTGVFAPAAAADPEPGPVWSWGGNEFGQLGDGTAADRLTPVQALGLSGVVAVAAGDAHSLALQDDGTVWAWGRNDGGQLGDGATADRFTPVQVVGLSGVVAVAAGGAHSLALRDDGTVWAWGWNDRGQVGDGDPNAQRHLPVQVDGLSGMTAIAAGGQHSLAVGDDGTVWAWGRNDAGQLGDGSQTDRFTPVETMGLDGVVAVAAGGLHSLAVRDDGVVWTWGHNGFGQLGDGGSSAQRNTPAPSPMDDAISVGAGSRHSLAVRSDGAVWAWGRNSSGQLGDGTTLNQDLPVQTTSLTGVTAADGGDAHSVAIDANGSVWAWGHNERGQLGDGTTTDRLTPVQTTGLTQADAIAGGGQHSLAVQSSQPGPDGMLRASVTVADLPETCILLSASALDFGTLPFGATGTSPEYAVSSCSDADQDLFAHGTGASAAGEGATWQLRPPPGDVNEFSVDANRLDDQGPVWLTDKAVDMGRLAGGGSADGRVHQLVMPQPGSDGAGKTMTFDIVWTAVLAE